MTEPTKPELLPCPFCGAGPAELMMFCDPLEGGDNSGSSRRVQCAGCNIEAPFYDTESEAIAAWNCRTLPTDPPAEWLEAMAEDIGNTMTDGAVLTARQIARAAYAALARQMGGGDAE